MCSSLALSLIVAATLVASAASATSKSPNGKIAFWSDLANVDGSSVRQLTRGRGENDAPSWSPDGRKVVFVGYRTSEPDLYVMNSNGTKPRRLTRTRIGEDADGWQRLPG